MYIKRVPTDQLVQDRVCLVRYHLNSTYCRQLPQMASDDDYLDKKSVILADATQYGLYSMIILTVPSVVAALFMGAWTDKYLGAKKALLIVGALAGVCEAVVLCLVDYFNDLSHFYVLLGLIPQILSGGMFAVFTAFWSYIATTTPRKWLALRMTIAEIIMAIAAPSATYIGGLVLNTNSFYSGGQLYNYSGAFMVGGAAYALVLLWTIFRINETKDTVDFEAKFNTNSNTESGQRVDIIGVKHRQFADNKHINPLKLLFSCDNMRDIWYTCAKPRANYVRLQIWLLFLSMAVFLLSYYGPLVFLYPFVQRIYSWDSAVYSNVLAIATIISAFATITIAPILIRVFGFKDTTLSLLGLIAYFGQNLVRGLMLNPMGFYISIGVGCLGPTASVGIRSHFSKIVESQELGKISSLMAAIDSIVPLIGSFFYTTVFNATMDSIPGLSFIITGSLLAIPVLIVLWIHYYTVLPDNNHEYSGNDVINFNQREIIT